MSEVFHHDISRDFYIFLMKKTLIDLLGYITPCWSWLSKKRTHPSGFKVMPLDDADEPWCGKGEGHGEHFLSYFRLVSGDFQGLLLAGCSNIVLFLFFRISKGSGSSDFCQRYSGIFLMLRGCMVVQQMCRTDVIPLSAVTASFGCFRFLMSRSFSWRCRVRKDGKIY